MLRVLCVAHLRNERLVGKSTFKGGPASAIVQSRSQELRDTPATVLMIFQESCL